MESYVLVRYIALKTVSDIRMFASVLLRSKMPDYSLWTKTLYDKLNLFYLRLLAIVLYMYITYAYILFLKEPLHTDHFSTIIALLDITVEYLTQFYFECVSTKDMTSREKHN